MPIAFDVSSSDESAFPDAESIGMHFFVRTETLVNTNKYAEIISINEKYNCFSPF
ncbi:hypothetical protein [Treponema saccharophilum]|uniref:hypothetical protein n=1 Tax=Treponema saccharophilum TaxID=165 RepID=UPI00131F31C0|nr:hypothetical protein [Treponema saccharophilum]